MAEEKKTADTQDNNSVDWFSDGLAELQVDAEISNVEIPVSRYDTLIRAEHTIELIRRVYKDSKIKYDNERTAAIMFLLGMETEDE